MIKCPFGCTWHYPCVECGEPHLGSHRPKCSLYRQPSAFRCCYCEAGKCVEHGTKTPQPKNGD